MHICKYSGVSKICKREGSVIIEIPITNEPKNGQTIPKLNTFIYHLFNCNIIQIIIEKKLVRIGPIGCYYLKFVSKDKILHLKNETERSPVHYNFLIIRSITIFHYVW